MTNRALLFRLSQSLLDGFTLFRLSPCA